jgi:threonylcarbamoyladenosine tRNA methylthiotransferase MtaB
MKRVAFYTLGCKLNFSETSTLSQQFEEAGFLKVDFQDKPDVFIINTCSVTENADKKCHKLVRDALKVSPHAFVGIVGCYAQLKPEAIAAIPGVDAVLGASEKFRLLELIHKFEKGEEALVFASPIDEAKAYHSSFSHNDRTRVFLKVQDGCNYSCTFCTIPLARGQSRSDTVARVVQTAQDIAQKDVKEIVLTGVNIGDFGLQNGKRVEHFVDLVRALDEVEGIERFRISSIEPNLLSDEIIHFVASSKRFVPHFHVPLQSGSNAILKRMKRRYLCELYQQRVAAIKSTMPHACIGVDVIVGFPGETDAHFMETYQFLNELDISYLHVFTYSERANTEAVEMENPVPGHKRAERSKMLHILSDKKRRYFYEQHLGETRGVLFEEEEKEGMMFGFSDNYIRVAAPYDPSLVNTIVPITLGQINADMHVEPVLSKAMNELV